MGDIKTPSSARGPRSLKILKRTSASVFSSRLPARSGKNKRHSHALIGARQIPRIDRQPWEERVADILTVLEDHRYGRANSLYSALDQANHALGEAARKKAEVETFAEELQASNEEMRASNEELKVITEEMERMHMDHERIVAKLQGEFLHNLNDISNVLRKTDEEKANQVEDVLQMMNGLLTYWQVGMTGSSFDPIHCEDIVDKLLEEFDDLVQEKEAEITYDSLPMIVADGDQLGMLFRVLIENSLMFSDKTPSLIHLKAQDIEQEKLTIPNSDMTSGWLFSIKDNGPGISIANQEALFQILTKEEDSSRNGGSGLAIAWKIVRRHGGRIWFNSDVTDGCEILFTLTERDL